MPKQERVWDVVYREHPSCVAIQDGHGATLADALQNMLDQQKASIDHAEQIALERATVRREIRCNIDALQEQS